MVLPTGPLPPNPAELISSTRMRPIIDGLKKGADVVIFDSPPLLAVADASELAARVDGTVLVVDSSKTRPRELSHARESLDRAGARILGVALNKLRRGQSSRSEYYYYYYYSYGYKARPDLCAVTRPTFASRLGGRKLDSATNQYRSVGRSP